MSDAFWHKYACLTNFLLGLDFHSLNTISSRFFNYLFFDLFILLLPTLHIPLGNYFSYSAILLTSPTSSPSSLPSLPFFPGIIFILYYIILILLPELFFFSPIRLYYFGEMFVCSPKCSPQGLEASFIQFKCTRYSPDNLTLSMRMDVQCFDSISDSFSGYYEMIIRTGIGSGGPVSQRCEVKSPSSQHFLVDFGSVG